MLRRALPVIALVALGALGALAASVVALGSFRDTTTGSSTGVTTTTTIPTGTVPTLPVTTVPLTTTAPTTTALTTTARTTTASTTSTTATTSTVPTSTSTTPAVSASPTTIVIDGHGWGHGMGMSQWGDYGYAKHGWTYTQILTHYYTGVTVAAKPEVPVRILLFDGVKRVALTSDSPWKVTDATGASVALPAGKLVLGADLMISGRALTGPLTFEPGTTPLTVGTRSYRGSVVATSTGTKLQIVNRLGLEQYVGGVLGSEVPSSWPAEALKAQAVAARSYALAELTTVVTARAYDLFSDTRSQAYLGIAAETPTTLAAVSATAGQVILSGGQVATAYYSSSTGGRTESSLDATGKDIPYLQSVDDPYDTFSPNHNWGPVLVDGAKAAKALGVPGGLIDLQVTNGPTGRAQKVVAVSPTASTTFRGETIRSALSLRSTWFSVRWLALAKTQTLPAGKVTSVTLTGVARGFASVQLEAKASGSAWALVGPVTPAADGSFSIAVRPTVTTLYRLVTGSIHGAQVTVAIAPVVTAAAAAGTVTGTVAPTAAGLPVELQLHTGSSWHTIVASTTDAAGGFSVGAQLAPGTYRVRCVPGGGLSPGLSALIVIT